MKNCFSLLVFSVITCLLLAFVFSSCKKEEIAQDGSIRAAAIVSVGICSVNTLITVNTTWFSTNTYILRGRVRVQPGATLTIQAGTRIQGECDGTLIVERDADIIAVGTAFNPIVFTSNKVAGSKAPGDWAGVIILGRAQNNTLGGNQGIEGIPLGSPGNNASGYHGPGGALNNADNSGQFRYVRIEYAGQALSPNNEVNSLTLGSVGSGTQIDHVQVLYSGDDSFEWFGGTVNASYLYSYGAIDDDFDTDNGYSGRVQFAAGVRVPSQFDIVSVYNNSNGFESDTDVMSAQLTTARFANVTIVGPTGADGVYFGSGALLRRNTAQKIYNSVFFGYGKTGTVAGTAAVNANGANPSAQVISSTLQNYTPGATTIPAGWAGLVTSTALSITVAEPATGTTSFTASSLVPSISGFQGQYTGGTTPPGAGFTTTTYRGAFGPVAADNTNWNLSAAAHWLRFPLLGQ